MNKAIYIHIGLPKTGTKFLQDKIYINAEKLKKNGIYVPKAGLKPFEHDYNLLALALQPERWSQFSTDISARLPNLWADFVTEIEKCDCPTVLVSSETLSWELKQTEQIKAVYEKLRNFKVKIILAERNPYDFISSMYGHMLRTGRGPYPLKSFLLEFPYYWSLEFHKRRWAEFFGEENILPLSYEYLSGEFLFEKFLNAVFPGHGVCSEQFEAVKEINRNKSLSPRFLRLLEELSANRIDIEPYVNMYSKLLEDFIPLESRTVTPADIDKALKSCGMTLKFSDVIVDVADHQKKYGDEQTEWLEKADKDLICRTQELLQTRQALADRTECLEQINKDLVERTRDLVDTRGILSEHTERLEQSSKDLVERTRELVETREILSERTERLEQANKDLVERTRDLVETREILSERTERLERATKGLVETRQSLVDRDKILEGIRSSPFGYAFKIAFKSFFNKL